MKLIKLVKKLLKQNALESGARAEILENVEYKIEKVIIIDDFLVAVMEHEVLYPQGELVAAALAKLKLKDYRGLIIFSKWVYEKVGLENEDIKVLLKHEMGHILAGFKERKGEKVKSLLDLARWYIIEEVRANKAAGILDSNYHASIIDLWKKALKGSDKELKMLAICGYLMLNDPEKEKIKKEVIECLNL